MYQNTRELWWVCSLNYDIKLLIKTLYWQFHLRPFVFFLHIYGKTYQIARLSLFLLLLHLNFFSHVIVEWISFLFFFNFNVGSSLCWFVRRYCMLENNGWSPFQCMIYVCEIITNKMAVSSSFLFSLNPNQKKIIYIHIAISLYSLTWTQ